MKLSDWARKQGISYLTAWRWFKAGKLPVPAVQLPTGTILVQERVEGTTVLYARVSGHDQKDHLQRQVERLRAWAKAQGIEDYTVVEEIGSGLNGRRTEGGGNSSVFSGTPGTPASWWSTGTGWPASALRA